eukprot:1153345-Pelagomonas_calceolata.AAC.4
MKGGKDESSRRKYKGRGYAAMLHWWGDSLGNTRKPLLKFTSLEAARRETCGGYCMKGADWLSGFQTEGDHLRNKTEARGAAWGPESENFRMSTCKTGCHPFHNPPIHDLKKLFDIFVRCNSGVSLGHNWKKVLSVSGEPCQKEARPIIDPQNDGITAAAGVAPRGGAGAPRPMRWTFHFWGIACKALPMCTQQSSSQQPPQNLALQHNKAVKEQLKSCSAG